MVTPRGGNVWFPWQPRWSGEISLSGRDGFPWQLVALRHAARVHRKLVRCPFRLHNGWLHYCVYRRVLGRLAQHPAAYDSQLEIRMSCGNGARIGSSFPCALWAPADQAQLGLPLIARPANYAPVLVLPE